MKKAGSSPPFSVSFRFQGVARSPAPPASVGDGAALPAEAGDVAAARRAGRQRNRRAGAARGHAHRAARRPHVGRRRRRRRRRRTEARRRRRRRRPVRRRRRRPEARRRRRRRRAVTRGGRRTPRIIRLRAGGKRRQSRHRRGRQQQRRNFTDWHTFLPPCPDNRVRWRARPEHDRSGAPNLTNPAVRHNWRRSRTAPAPAATTRPAAHGLIAPAGLTHNRAAGAPAPRKARQRTRPCSAERTKPNPGRRSA